MQERTKHFAGWMSFTFQECPEENTPSDLYRETVPRNRPNFLEESLRGEKLVKNLEIF